MEPTPPGNDRFGFTFQRGLLPVVGAACGLGFAPKPPAGLKPAGGIESRLLESGGPAHGSLPPLLDDILQRLVMLNNESYSLNKRSSAINASFRAAARSLASSPLLTSICK